MHDRKVADSLILLKTMVDNKYKVFEDDVYPEYFKAWSEYMNILSERDYHINDTSMRLIVRTFNREDDDELCDMLKEALYTWLDDFGKVDMYVEEFIKNESGYYESLGVLDLYSHDLDNKKKVERSLRRLPIAYKEKIVTYLGHYKMEYIKDLDIM